MKRSRIFNSLITILLFALIVVPINHNAYAFFTGFESGQGKDGEYINDIMGIHFTNTSGFDWNYCDITTGGYNAHSVDLGLSYGTAEYSMNGKVSAWLGTTQGSGRIDFDKQDGSWFQIGYSSASTFYLEAYDKNNNLIAQKSGSANLSQNTMSYLRVDAPSDKSIAYVTVHDSGNMWTVDDISGDFLKPQKYAVLTGKITWTTWVKHLLVGMGWDEKNIFNMGGEAFSDSWINDLKAKVNPGDEFLFYYGGHGGVGSKSESLGEYASTNGIGPNGSDTFTLKDLDGKTYTYKWAGDEGLAYDEGAPLTDDNLTKLFATTEWENVNKTFLLDACHAGGFIGGGDGDLDSLTNMRLIAGAYENEFVELTGLGLTYLTHEVLGLGIDLGYADYNDDNLITWDEFKKFIISKGANNYEYAYIFDSDFETVDYDALYSGIQHLLYYSNIPLNHDVNEFGSYNTSVPEPATMLLLGLGLLGLAGVRRKITK